jgi:competence protein ComEC
LLAKLGRSMLRPYEDGRRRLAKDPRALLCLLAGLFVSAAAATALPSTDPSKSLRVYFVDVEGGQATLFVTPEGNSLLIDTGWPGNNGRDADRIVAAAHDAGIQKIDYVLITHYHDDHVGGAPQLAAKIPIGTFIDHSENREPGAQKLYDAYKVLLDSGKYKHIVAKPGDLLPIKGMRAEVISSDGAVISTPLPSAGQPNPTCNDFNPPDDKTENPRSLGTLFTFGKLKILDLGDLTANKEKELMCPINRIGRIDIFIASHHGFDQSDSAALVHGIAPRVAIVDNGEKKGGSPSVLDIIKSSPGIVGIWQLHYAQESGDAHNAPAGSIANLQGPDAGNYLKVIAERDGSFAVFNSRTKETKTYSAPQ